MPLPFVNGVYLDAHVDVMLIDDNIRIRTNRNYTGYSNSFIVIEYTRN